MLHSLEGQRPNVKVHRARATALADVGTIRCAGSGATASSTASPFPVVRRYGRSGQSEPLASVTSRAHPLVDNARSPPAPSRDRSVPTSTPPGFEPYPKVALRQPMLRCAANPASSGQQFLFVFVATRPRRIGRRATRTCRGQCPCVTTDSKGVGRVPRAHRRIPSPPSKWPARPQCCRTSRFSGPARRPSIH